MTRLALTFLLACLLLAACSPTVILLTDEPESTSTSIAVPQPPDATPAPAPTRVPGPKLGISPDQIRGTVVSLWHGLDGESGALLAQMASEFSQKNPWGVQVNVTSQKNQSLLVQAVETASSGPEHPDLVLALPEHAQAWDAQGLVTDLMPYIAQPGFGLLEVEINDIPPAFWKQGKVGQRQLSIPAVRTARLLFYNVSFAKALGFSTPPQSAEDFRTQACAANAFWKTDNDQTNDGLGGWVLDKVVMDIDAPWTAYAWLRSLGGDIYTDGNFAFFTPENQSALVFLDKMWSDDCIFTTQILPNQDTTPAETLARRQALFASGSLQDLPRQRAAFAGSPDQWTVIAFPGAAPAIAAYGPDFVVLKSSEARQLAAWLFIHWMLAPENQARWQRGTGLFPIRSSAVALLENIRNANPQWSAAMDLVPQARLYPQSAVWPKARLVLGDGFFQLFQLNPSESDVIRTLHLMDDTVKDLLP
jgi:ABC-type glycerol-3-phosphate transport system substrate-binding protein